MKGATMPTSNESLYLPADYQTNEQRSSESTGSAFWTDNDATDAWQVPIYRLAARLIRARGLRAVVDIGTGTGTKAYTNLGHLVQLTGWDQASGIEIARSRHPDAQWMTGDLNDDAMWQQIAKLEPELVLCADVIEHVDDPIGLLANLRGVLGHGASLLISTPDRSLLETGLPLGPPSNQRHVREWTAEEFRQLLAASSLEVTGFWRLRPRIYTAAPREAVRAVHRLMRGKHPLDARSSIAFEVRPA
jgi:SAM-dependent methyltransferase